MYSSLCYIMFNIYLKKETTLKLLLYIMTLCLIYSYIAFHKILKGFNIYFDKIYELN